MTAANTIQEPLRNGLDDVPPPPPSYSQYVERTMHDRIQTAYERGLERGLKYRFVALLIGLILGWVAGSGFANMQ